MEKAKFDKLHYSWRDIDGYDKNINIVISPRELGKTTTWWCQKAYPCWKRKEAIVYLVRNINEITDEMISSIFEQNINKFYEDEKPIYKANFKDGVVDIFLEDKETKERFRAIRIIALSCKLRKLKQTTIPNLRYMFIDEYIINPNVNESYLKDEAFKIKELFSTLKRGAINERLKFYVAGNPYSLFNPLFIDLNVDVSKLRLGEKYIGDDFIIDYPKLNPLLREKIMKENPFYKFDESYSTFAVEGTAINDMNIPLGDRPINFSLKYIFRINNTFLGIYKNNSNNGDYSYYCEELETFSRIRDVYCIDLKDMIAKTILLSNEEKFYLNRFKDSFAKQSVLFNNINCYYYVKEIFTKL